LILCRPLLSLSLLFCIGLGTLAGSTSLKTLQTIIPTANLGSTNAGIILELREEHSRRRIGMRRLNYANKLSKTDIFAQVIK
jgi:hypothetical protein